MKVSYELSRIDSENWKENALKHKEQLDHIDEKTEEISNIIASYKSQHQELLDELRNYESQRDKMLKEIDTHKKENEKQKLFVKISFVVIAILFIALIVMVILFAVKK